MRKLRTIAIGLIVLASCSWQRPGSAAEGPSRPLLPPAIRSQAPEPPEPELRPAAGPGGGLPAPEGRITARVVARVNGQPILWEEVYNAASWRMNEAQSQASPAQLRAMQEKMFRDELEQVIDRELLLEEARLRIPAKNLEKVREGAQREFESQLRRQRELLRLKTDEELRNYLQKQGRSVEEMQRQYERSYVAMQYLRARIKDKLDEIDREQLLEYYRNNPREFERPERVQWQYLFVDVDLYPNLAAARQYAEQVYAQARGVKTTEEFARLAEEFGHGSSKYRRGEGEGNERGMVQPADLEELVFRLRPGQVSELVENRRGFHIVRKVDHERGGRLPFDAACLDIKKKLQFKVFEAEQKRILQELRDQAHIENTLDPRN